MLNHTTQHLLDQLIDNMLSEYRLEQEFLAVLRDANTDPAEIINYINDRLTTHADRPMNFHVNRDRIAEYVASRRKLADWKTRRDDIERQRYDLATELDELENEFCTMMLDDYTTEDDVEFLLDEIWPKDLQGH